ncbi:inner membrane protein YgaP [Janthinobacterium sp. HH107]|uniref:rhodanese-like domain-containing protein n=1 Tax=unclassified Janthinobacterium TaxID=2610881 RepID=UPI0008744F40|nr:rhodanese-like domain-containing protein [Janthinobacterium sp. HH107]OEZ93672.1 inner membrane protein YgaP [Janthinobacterium sp. HH107]
MKFIIDHIFLFAIVIISGGALLWPLLSMRGKRATVLEVTQLINRGKTIIVDVRSAEEFATGHLPDAKNIPLPELAKRLSELEKFKTRPIVVVCQKGSRSATAVGLLGKAGFAEATSLEGGLDEWKKQGLPLKTLSLAK